jgi:hypothetical protein
VSSHDDAGSKTKNCRNGDGYRKSKLSAVNIVLYNSKNELIKELKTDGSGGFILEGINEQNVKLVVRNNGYSVFEKNLDLEKPDALQIILRKETREIEEVVMTKRNPVVKRKVDRLEFNVENSNISSLNAWEILKKTQMLLLIIMY